MIQAPLELIKNWVRFVSRGIFYSQLGPKNVCELQPMYELVAHLWATDQPIDVLFQL